MTKAMRRGTPSAELLGGLLEMIRTAGTTYSMRQVGDRIGAPAATVSQIEKGQRALKEPKIAIWSEALDVDEANLVELWWLCQGEVLVGDRRCFYTEAGEGLGTEHLQAEIVKALQKQPDLEPIYRLAELITRVLERLLPNAGLRVEPTEYEPLHLEKMAADMELTGSEQDEQAEHGATFLCLPLIECFWDDASRRRPNSGISQRFQMQVPLLQELMPIVRRRGKSVDAEKVEDLVRTLSGPERERVRGYIEAIVEQRNSDD
jgi:transcriptional regulator with XRE-family HTH domain